MGPGMMGGMGAWMLLWTLLALALLALTVVAIVYLVRRMPGGAGHAGEGRDQALADLRQRYARGEIDREEYLARREDLASPR